MDFFLIKNVFELLFKYYVFLNEMGVYRIILTTIDRRSKGKIIEVFG